MKMENNIWLTLLCFTLVLPAAGIRAQAEWTFMVYMAADNNLEGFGIEDFLEMASAGSTADVKILTLFDRIPGNDTRYDDWTDTRRGIVNSADVPDASWGVSMGELNMGDPQNLIDFVEWGMQNYPASKYAVILWDHGTGWQKEDGHRLYPFKAVCGDSTDGEDILLMPEVWHALATIEADIQEPDLIGFDACLMGMVEVAYEIHDFGSVMVASECGIPGSGWPYHTILTHLSGLPTMTARELGEVIVLRYDDEYGHHQILSAIDLAELDTLATGINLLAQELRSNWNGDVIACLERADDVMESMDRAIIIERHGLAWPGANGLAVFFPDSADPFDYWQPYYSGGILFGLSTLWDEFLQDYYAVMAGSWVQEACGASQKFCYCECDLDYFEHVDLFDFCEKLLVHAPDVIWVDFSYTGPESGTYSEPYSTVGTAVTAAGGGETIIIMAGTSAEAPTITKELTLYPFRGTAVLGKVSSKVRQDAGAEEPATILQDEQRHPKRQETKNDKKT